MNKKSTNRYGYYSTEATIAEDLKIEESTREAADKRKAFYASARVIDAMCSSCKQPQNAPSCERREHWV